MIEWLVLTAKLAAVWIAAAFVFGLVAGRLMAAGQPDEKKGDRQCRKTS